MISNLNPCDCTYTAGFLINLFYTENSTKFAFTLQYHQVKFKQIFLGLLKQIVAKSNNF